jgi:hypothetical protein
MQFKEKLMDWNGILSFPNQNISESTTECLLKRMLVKDQDHRASFEEIEQFFKYKMK